MADFDYKEFEAFANNVKNMQKDFDSFLQDLMVETLERIVGKAKLKTPVDTGALRAAWQIGDIRRVGNTIVGEVLNGMEYSTFVEYGHRLVSGGVEIGWVEGRFMLTLAIDEVQQRFERQFNSDFIKFCKDYGLG